MVGQDTTIFPSLVIDDNHIVELTFSMSWMNMLRSMVIETLDDIMSWSSSSQDSGWRECIMCWCISRSRSEEDHHVLMILKSRAWSKGCIMCWCVSRSRRGDDRELIIKSREDPSCVDGAQVKDASCVDAYQDSGWRMSSCVDEHQVKIPKQAKEIIMCWWLSSQEPGLEARMCVIKASSGVQGKGTTS